MTCHDASRPHDHLIETEAARFLRLSPRTLQRHRVAGTGPVFVRLGRRVVYRRTDLLDWVDANRHASTAA